MSELNKNNLCHANNDTDRTTVTNWLNDAATCQTASEKIELLHKVQEFVIHKTPWLLLELTTDVLAFASDRNGDVKKCIVGFIEEACKRDETLIPKVVVNLHLLLCDESVQVQKRVIQASSSVYKNMVIWLSKAQIITDEMEQAWDVLNHIKIEIVNMIDSDNDGVRTHSTKFLESVVLLQTYPELGAPRKDGDFSLEDIPLTLKIARRRKLEEEANHIFSLLVKFHGSPHISSVNLMACMGSLCTIAKLRPEFMSKVISALENLQSNLPPTLSHSQVNSVRKHLKLQLLNILKHYSSGEHRSSIVGLLSDLGYSSQELAKLVPRLDDKKRVQKRNSDSVSNPIVKKARLVQELEMKMEESLKQKQHVNEINRRFIEENLNINVATQIIFATIQNVPNTMPSNFPHEYLKIFHSNNSITVKDIAKLLAEQFAMAEVGPGTKSAYDSPINIGQTPESSVIKEYETPDIKIDKHVREIKTGRVVKPRIKTLKLSEITRPVNSELREKLLITSVQRLLQAEKAASKVGVAHIRYKIITTLACMFGSPVRKTILMFVFDDMRCHMDLALAWLYEEYSLMQGFNRMSILKREVKPDESYNTLLCSLVSHLQEGDIRDRDGLIARLFLEAPLLTDESLNLLKQMCKRTDRCIPALNLMHDLVIRRPPKGTFYLTALLTFSTFENITVREESVARVISLYERTEWQSYIEKYAIEYLEMLTLKKPPEILFGEDTGRPVKTDMWNDDLNRVCLCLYLALLPYNETLIHKLSEVYVQTSPDIKRAILRLVEHPVRGMGMDSPELLMLVEKCPKGSETLVTRIIHILSDRGPPSSQLVNRVRDLYQSRVSDVRFLIPVLNGLTKKEVTAALPKLIKLNPVVVKEVFNRLLGQHGDSPITPSELLIALHLIDPSKAEIKAVMKATSLCFAEKQVYTQEVLAVVMQQLMDINPLPTLLMRTVIQSLSLYPRLTGFVMNILQRLILKQVWRQKIVWEGFIKCCQRTKPQSFQVLLQLPALQLAEALAVCPDIKQPLLEHVQALSDTQRAHVPISIMDILLGQTQAPLTTSNTLVDNDHVELKEIKETLDEPLPPGME